MVFGELTPAERHVIDESAHGRVADCREFADLPEEQRSTVTGPTDVALARLFGSKLPSVRPELIAALATEDFEHPDYPDWKLSPEGVRVRSIRIEGTLDLGNRTVYRPLWLRCCFISGAPNDAVDLSGGEFRTLDLAGTVVVGRIFALRTRFEGNVFMGDAAVHGEIRLIRARIAGEFGADRMEIENADGYALSADRVQAAAWFMNEAVVRGETRLVGARIEGQFRANKAVFESARNDALNADRVEADGWFMNEAAVRGTMRLLGARIKGQFSVNNATFVKIGGYALIADALRADGWFMNNAVVHGTMQLLGAHIEGQFAALKATFENASGTALGAQGARVGAWIMAEARVSGEVHMLGVRIEGEFVADGAIFDNRTGNAVYLAHAQIVRGFYMRAVGGSPTVATGAVELTHAALGYLDLSGLVCKASQSVALGMPRCIVRGDALLFGSFTSYGAVVLDRARFEGALKLGGNFICSSIARHKQIIDWPWPGDEYIDCAISLVDVQVDGRLVLPESFPEGIVDLSRAYAATLEDSRSGWPPPLVPGASACEQRLSLEGRDIQHLILDGFEYDFLKNPAGMERLDWLRGQHADQLTRYFSPQPWRQLARVLRNQGHSNDARRLTIERNAQERRSHSMAPHRRVVNWILHRLADYGFNPWKTVGWSIAVIALSGAIYWSGTTACGSVDCADDSAFVCSQVDGLEARRPGLRPVTEHYPPFQPFIYSLDVFVPILDFGMEEYYRPNTRLPAGRTLYEVMVLERIVGAFLVALAITGFTGLLTRDEP